ncbi:MAG: TadE/TadG family type IV pilus assembly protein [Acidobacteriota bacterium]
MKRRGTTTLETAMFLPLLLLLFMGMVEVGRVTYTYFTLHKMLYSLGRLLGTQQGVNFCDDADATVETAKNLVLTGTIDGSAGPLVANLTPDLVQVSIERRNADSGELENCDCAVPGCDVVNGGLAPDYLVIAIPDGYQVQLRIPYVMLAPLPLKPQIRVPYGGT